jgi:hypothetical protein
MKKNKNKQLNCGLYTELNKLENQGGGVDGIGLIFPVMIFLIILITLAFIFSPPIQ